MTDGERIARLTELARRVWPGDKLDIVMRGGAVRVMLGGEDTGMPMITTSLLTIVHPRPLDALEAALLVLARCPDSEAKLAKVQAWYDAAGIDPEVWELGAILDGEP